jgi:quaternary ammonium compound-resistance protein SugE
MEAAATTFPPRLGSQDRDGPAALLTETAVAWIALVLAGLFEIGWPVGLKMAQAPASRVSGICVAVVFMGISGALLWFAQRQIPMGTAYAVWTGIGAAGTFLVGVLFYGDPTSFARYAGVALIVGGVITLKLAP